MPDPARQARRCGPSSASFGPSASHAPSVLRSLCPSREYGLADTTYPVIPFRYHYGMSRQIAIRLADDLVEFVDQLVGSGAGRSRAAVVTKALERERRRVIAARDAEILAKSGSDPELAGLAEHATGLPSTFA
jgi:Arc/MetJ-type ribon-helix-helix transcriptional regulator